MTDRIEFKLLREELGFTQEQLARILGVSFSTVNRWEKGKSFPRKEMIEKLQGLTSKKSVKLNITKKLVGIAKDKNIKNILIIY